VLRKTQGWTRRSDGNGELQTDYELEHDAQDTREAGAPVLEASVA